MRRLLKKWFGSEASSGSDKKESLPEATLAGGPWIGVDLDGTLVRFTGWRGFEHVGRPVPAMLQRVKEWLEQGYRVKIVTARAAHPEGIPPIRKWLKKRGLEQVEVTNTIDGDLIELWDDRGVQILTNKGRPVRSPSIMARPRAPLLEESFPHEKKRRPQA